MLKEDVLFCPRCGTALISKERMGRLRPICPSCDWVFFPDPKVAAGMVVVQHGKVLLVRRIYNPKRGFWTLPVGFVDAGEDPAQAAERECQEETGLEVQAIKLLDVISGQTHPRGAHIIIFYLGEIISGDLQASDDVDQAKFFSLDEIPPLAFPSTQKILDGFKHKNA